MLKWPTKVFATKSKTNHQMMQNLQEFEPWLEELNLTLKDGGIFLPSSATDNWRIKTRTKKVQNIKKQEERKCKDIQLFVRKLCHKSIHSTKEGNDLLFCTSLGETSKFNKKKHFLWDKHLELRQNVQTMIDCQGNAPAKKKLQNAPAGKEFHLISSIVKVLNILKTIRNKHAKLQRTVTVLLMNF